MSALDSQLTELLHRESMLKRAHGALSDAGCLVPGELDETIEFAIYALADRAINAEERLEHMARARDEFKRERDYILLLLGDKDEFKRERDEARTQLAAINSLHGALAAINAMARERDEALAEVERLRELLDENAYERGLLARRMTEAQARRDEAYRRGAEAMREKAAAAIVCPAESCPCKGALHARIIRALPIPEEP